MHFGALLIQWKTWSAQPPVTSTLETRRGSEYIPQSYWRSFRNVRDSSNQYRVDTSNRYAPLANDTRVMEPRIIGNHPVLHPPHNQYPSENYHQLDFQGGTRGGHKEMEMQDRKQRGGGAFTPQKKENIGESGIINLSTKKLSREELATLSKGLKFAPPWNLNKFQIFIDIQKYTVSLTLRDIFWAIPPGNWLGMHRLSPVRVYPTHHFLTLPGNMATNVNVFRDLVVKDLENLKTKLVQPQQDIKIGMDTLCNRKDIVVRPADKGGARRDPGHWGILARN